jgi:hypothetical protein
MTDTCVFCGDAPTTLEHVFSTAWIAALMPETTSWTSDLFRQEEGGATERAQWVKPKTPKSRVGAPEVRCACAPCNNGWMQELDVEVQPALTPLALGETGTVSERGVQLAAAWATKVALVLDSMFSKEIIDRQIKGSFGKMRVPPPSWSIWASAMSPTTDSTRVRGLTLSSDPSGAEPLAYVGTFRIVHLVVQVFCPLRDDVVFARTGGWEKRVVRLWPGGGSLRWPPPASTWLTTEAEFEELAQAVVAAPG